MLRAVLVPLVAARSEPEALDLRAVVDELRAVIGQHQSVIGHFAAPSESSQRYLSSFQAFAQSLLPARPTTEVAETEQVAGAQSMNIPANSLGHLCTHRATGWKRSGNVQHGRVIDARLICKPQANVVQPVHFGIGVCVGNGPHFIVCQLGRVSDRVTRL
jgi:hypothetical protein